MMKRISMFVVLAMAITITTVFAVESKLSYNIEQSKKLAAENSRQTAIDDLEIKAKESALEDAEHDAGMTTGGSSKIDMLNNRIIKEVNPVKAAADLEYTKRKRDSNIEKLELDVYKASLNMLLIQKELELENSKLDILNEKYQMAEVRYNEGKITESDLYNAKHALDSKTIDRNKAQKKLESANLELKRLLGISMDGEVIQVDDQLKLVTASDIDIEKVVDGALENDADVYIKNEELIAKEKTMEITEEYYSAGNTTYDDNKLNLETAKADLEDARTNLEVAIRNKYNDLLTRKDKVELSGKWEEISKNKLESAEFKYEKGLISKEELLSAKEQYLDAQYQKYLAIYEYNTIDSEFDTLYVKQND